MHWQRLRSLQGGGVPTALPRRCLAARALSTNAAAVKRLLEGRQWLLPDPAVQASGGGWAPGQQGGADRALPPLPPLTLHLLWARARLQVTQVQPEGLPAGFAVIRDDLTHPLIGGNKWRKLDGLWPQLEQVQGSRRARRRGCRAPLWHCFAIQQCCCCCVMQGQGGALVPARLLHLVLLPRPPRCFRTTAPLLLPSPAPLQATDIITCGGLQSAHTLAVAAAAAEHGKRAHLLVRGERPAVPTGSHL